MAQPVQPSIFGADVGQQTLEIAAYGGASIESLENCPSAIRAWLKRQPGPVELALEATGAYHFDLLEIAHRHGARVYVVDAHRLAHYRKSIGVRSKTDRCDARLLARYLAHEQSHLRAWQPPPKGYREAWQLLHRRAKLVKARTMLEQSFRDLPGFKRELQAVQRRLKSLEKRLEKRLHRLIDRQGWSEAWRCCGSVSGIGDLSAAALVVAYHRGPFRSSDAFVSFLGLDVRRRESGRYVGKSKLTKKGDPECRRILHNAARSAAQREFRAYYEQLLARGMATTQAHVAVTRKLVRICFSLIQSGQRFDPARLQQA